MGSRDSAHRRRRKNIEDGTDEDVREPSDDEPSDGDDECRDDDSDDNRDDDSDDNPDDDSDDNPDDDSDDNPDDDKPNQSGRSSGSGRGPWTALTRYANDDRVDQVTTLLEEADVPFRVEAEGRATLELNRIRVPVDLLEDAVDAIEEPVLDLIPEPADERGLSGAFGRLRRRKVETHLETQASEAIDDDDFDAAIDSLWRLADLDPRDRMTRARLIDALIDRGGEGDLELARLRLEEAMRHDGIGVVAIELSRVAVASDSLDEAEALLDEAAESGADSAEVAFDRCGLAYAIGEPRGLKQAASEFRRICSAPDRNWVEIALMLAAAGEGEAASRMLGAALRDAGDLGEGDWAQAAALKMVVEGADKESRSELSDLLGGEPAEESEAEVTEWLRDSKREWKAAFAKSKARKKARGSERSGRKGRRSDRDDDSGDDSYE